MIRFEANCTVSVVKQAKYRIKHAVEGFKVEIVMDTPDGERLYPASRQHPELVKMVNEVKQTHGGGEAGSFYINEHRQVIVPAGNPVEYYYAGEYLHDIILELENQQFSGRPFNGEGNLLRPGDHWTGRPRPGIKYTLKAGGADIEYEREISPGRTRVVRLSKVVGATDARKTSRKVAAVKGNAGGPFYVNEYRAIFGPVMKSDVLDYVFIGLLAESDPWFPKWSPQSGAGITEVPPFLSPTDSRPPEKEIKSVPEPQLLRSGPEEKTLEIEDEGTGYTYERLFAPYLRGATIVVVEDGYIARAHQVANFLRFCEMCVRIGGISKITLVTRPVSDDVYARMTSMRLSLAGHAVELDLKPDRTIHARRITANHGWEIHLDRGLDIYKCPEDYCSIGASDFELRPCYKTRLIFQKKANMENSDLKATDQA